MTGKTDEILKKLFDHLKSEKAPGSERIIKAAGGNTEELPDEGLSHINAAGEITLDYMGQMRVSTDYRIENEQ